jgi:hypothetical protein
MQWLNRALSGKINNGGPSLKNESLHDGVSKRARQVRLAASLQGDGRASLAALATHWTAAWPCGEQAGRRCREAAAHPVALQYHE